MCWTFPVVKIFFHICFDFEIFYDVCCPECVPNWSEILSFYLQLLIAFQYLIIIEFCFQL